MRARVTAVLGDRPAVLAVQPREHPLHQPGRVTQRLVPSEPRRDPIDHLTECVLPHVNIYAVSRGHRRSFFVTHKHGMLMRWPLPMPTTHPRRRVALTASASQVTIYGCRKSPEIDYHHRVFGHEHLSLHRSSRVQQLGQAEI